MTPSPTQSQINAALASFLASVFPDGDAVFKGLINGTLLVVFTPPAVVTTATESKQPAGMFAGTMKITPFTPGYPYDPT